MRKTILVYGLVLGAALIALKALEYTFLYRQVSLEIYLGLIALFFLGIGLYVGQKAKKPQVIEVAPAAPITPDLEALASLGISKRELEVLELLGEGLSNQEIADRLFVSLNTIKTHINRVYGKLDVKRRTQAIAKAKALNLIA